MNKMARNVFRLSRAPVCMYRTVCKLYYIYTPNINNNVNDKNNNLQIHATHTWCKSNRNTRTWRRRRRRVAGVTLREIICITEQVVPLSKLYNCSKSQSWMFSTTATSYMLIVRVYVHNPLTTTDPERKRISRKRE